MGSRGRRGNASWWLRLVSACLALCLLLAHRLSPCEGRKLLAVEQEGGKAAMYFEGDLVLRVPPSPSAGNGGGRVEEPAAVPRGFSASGGRAARLMHSVPSPGVGH